MVVINVILLKQKIIILRQVVVQREKFYSISILITVFYSQILDLVCFKVYWFYYGFKTRSALIMNVRRFDTKDVTRSL